MLPLRVAIIGTGIMGRGHGEFIRDHVKEATVVALSDVDSNRVNALAADLGGQDFVATFNSLDEMLNKAKPDALIIASPDNLHTEHLRIALKHDISVLCEKPIAITLEDARSIANEVRAYEKSAGGKRVHYGFMRRFDPSYLQLRTLMESGDYGQPLFIRTITRNVTSSGITTEGLYTNIAVHDFDVWRWLTKSEWKKVDSHYPKSSSLSPQGIIDPLVFTAQLENELMIVADIVANDNYGYDLRTEVLCEKGSLEIGTFGDVYIRANHFAGTPLGGQMVDNWIPRFKDAYIAELKAWVSSVQTGEIHPDLADVEDALAATEACFLALKSLN